MVSKRVGPAAVAALLAGGFAFWAGGCGESRSQEYKEFAELDSADLDDSSAQQSVLESPAELVQNAAPDASSEPTADADPTLANGNGRTTDEDDAREPFPAQDDRSGVAPAAQRNQPSPTIAGGAPVSATGTTTRPAESERPREVKVLVKNREFKVEGPENAVRVSYDDIDLLKVLNMDPVTPDAPNLMPDWLRNLDGRRIRIRGFMYPPFQETGIKTFALARDNQICCFGRDPKIYDVFSVRLREGVTTSYIQNRPFDVAGVFHVRPIAEEGQLFQLYEIDDAIVIE